MRLVVGLGNPGDKYANARHNLGFMVLEELAKRINSQESSFKIEKKFKSEILRSIQLILAKPQTFMNNSGLAVKLLINFYKIPVENVIVIHDDLDLPLGKIKVRLGGAAAGHHGVESIIKELGTDKFIRVRLGILGAVRVLRDTNFNAEKFVLEPFMPSEKSKVKHMIKQAVVDILNLCRYTFRNGLI